MSSFYSLETERKVLSGLVQHQKDFYEYDEILTEEDFKHEGSNAHLTLFKLIRHSLRNNEELDQISLISRLNTLKVTFPDSISVPEYLEILFIFKVSKEILATHIRDLKKFTTRRVLNDKLEKEQRFLRDAGPDISAVEILERVESEVSRTVSVLTESQDNAIIDLYEQMPEVVEDRVNNPVNSGPEGPHKLTQEMFGSFFRPGNITSIVARAKVGKTTFSMDYAMKAGMKNNLPVLTIDYSEMSSEELIMRQVAALSGIPLHLVESGDFARVPSWGKMSGAEVKKRVRDSYEKVKKHKFYYMSIGGQNPDELISMVKRFYYSKIGRGNPLLLCYDYLKLDFSNSNNDNQWVAVARVLHALKRLVQVELCFNNKPVVGLLTSVQANRGGIVTGKRPDQIVEDESVIGLTDTISHFSSHVFLFRKKVIEEISQEGEEFGTHKLIPLLNRHLGKDVQGVLEPVEIDGKKRQNFINFNIKNFEVQEAGDLRAIAAKMENNRRVSPVENDKVNDVPAVFKNGS